MTARDTEFRIDGRELFQRVSQQHPGLEERIVFCSGDLEVARLRGMPNPILPKPTGRGALLAALLGVVRSAEAKDGHSGP